MTTVYLSGKPENVIWVSNLHNLSRWYLPTSKYGSSHSQWSYEPQATTWKWFPTHSFFGFRCASVVFWFSSLTLVPVAKITVLLCSPKTPGRPSSTFDLSWNALPSCLVIRTTFDRFGLLLAFLSRQLSGGSKRGGGGGGGELGDLYPTPNFWDFYFLTKTSRILLNEYEICLKMLEIVISETEIFKTFWGSILQISIGILRLLRS